MKILLTGAGGFLGRRIARSLLDAGATDLRLHYRRITDPASIDALRRAYPGARIETVEANLLTPGPLAALTRDVDCLIHAAAGMRGAVADMFANTVVGTRNLLDAAAQAQVGRIVLISSFAVYQTAHLAPGALLSEQTPLEPEPVRRGAYAYAKTRQEQLFREFADRHGIETVILRPGVIYGPGGGAMSPRVGLAAMGLFVSLGNQALLPLTYVDNCADAVARAALHAPAGSAFNVVDDDLPTCSAYLDAYRRQVKRMRVVRLPLWLFSRSAGWLESYHKRSKGQLPAVFTPYSVASMYRPLRYSNQALKAIGWTQRHGTAQALDTSFAAWREATQ